MARASRFPDDFPSLTSEDVSLRELNDSDIPGWYRRATDQESALLSGDRIPGSLAEGYAWLSRQQQLFATNLGLRWAITVANDQQSIGTVGLVLSSAGNDWAELGIVIARDYWGRGLGLASTRLVLNYAFEVMGLQRVEAQVLVHNVSCRRVLEKSGFSLVQCFIEQLPTDPSPVEMCLYETNKK